MYLAFIPFGLPAFFTAEICFPLLVGCKSVFFLLMAAAAAAASGAGAGAASTFNERAEDRVTTRDSPLCTRSNPGGRCTNPLFSCRTITFVYFAKFLRVRRSEI